MFKKLPHWIVAFLINIFFSSNIYAQTWCPPGATWYYGNSGLYYNGYVKMAYARDSVINSITCKEITYYSEGAWWDVFNGGQAYHTYGYGSSYFTYEQNGVVYVYNNRFGNNQFDTLYNINAQIGDSWHIPLYGGDTTCADSLHTMKVINTGTQIINGFNLKTLDVTVGSEFQTTFHIIERLGYRYDDLEYGYYCHGIIAESSHGELRCYSDSVFGSISAGVNPCDYYYTDVPEFELNRRWANVYPNPASDKLTIAIELKQSETLVIEILDITGKLEYLYQLNNQNFINEISLTDLSEGMYLYKVNVNNTNVKLGKLIITRY